MIQQVLFFILLNPIFLNSLPTIDSSPQSENFYSQSECLITRTSALLAKKDVDSLQDFHFASVATLIRGLSDLSETRLKRWGVRRGVDLLECRDSALSCLSYGSLVPANIVKSFSSELKQSQRTLVNFIYSTEFNATACEVHGRGSFYETECEAQLHGFLTSYQQTSPVLEDVPQLLLVTDQQRRVELKTFDELRGAESYIIEAADSGKLIINLRKQLGDLLVELRNMFEVFNDWLPPLVDPPCASGISKIFQLAVQTLIKNTNERKDNLCSMLHDLFNVSPAQPRATTSGVSSSTLAPVLPDSNGAGRGKRSIWTTLFGKYFLKHIIHLLHTIILT